MSQDVRTAPSGSATGSRESPVTGTPVSEEPINLRLKRKPQTLSLKPRSYQTDLYLKTLKGNVIIYLGTGLGKTYIIVLFLNDPYIDVQIQAGRKVVFMAPTQDLVKQQAEYINKQVRYRVKIFCGRSAHCGEHIDHWDKRTWDGELENVDILFMTPQIFSAAVSTNHLDWTKFAAVIFDEAHHALASKKKVSGHPYYQILKSYQAFYMCRFDDNLYPRPRLIGLTASLINAMPKNRDSIREEISHLERNFSARCITNLQAQEKKPKLVIHSYTSFSLSDDFDLLTSMFTSFIECIKLALKTEKANKLCAMKSYDLTKDDEKLLAFHNRLRLAAIGFSIKPSSFPKVVEGLKNIRLRCGLWPLRTVCFKLIEVLRKHKDSSCIPKEMVPIYADFTTMLEEIHNTIDNHLNLQPDKGLLSYTTPKLRALLDILKREYERTVNGLNGKSTFSCIIFVTSRLEVIGLNAWLQMVSSCFEEYSFIKCDYAIGLAATMSSKYACITKRKPIQQYKMLRDFRESILNTIVTTSVLEEGIDLPVCSTVIRYDSSHNFRQYVQSRGRARQDISSYITMCRTNDFAIETDKLDKFYDFEITLRQKLNDKDIASIARQTLRVRDIPLEEKEDFFLCKDDSIRITSSTARTILNMYCNRLAQKTPYTEGVRYDRFEPKTGYFQTILYLPSGCPLHDGIRGNVKVSATLADDSAVVASVKALYEAQELNEYGAPTRVTEANIDILLASKNLKPQFDELDRSQEGECVNSEDGRQVFIFEPAIRRECNLMNGCENRTYKLVRIAFESQNHFATREETLPFFEKSVFGLIIDASTSLEFIPPSIYHHYGQFKVNFKVVSNNLLIKRSQDHNEYLHYTYRLLRSCLAMSSLDKDDLRNHCRFYVVPLNIEDKPDFDKMKRSFYSENRDLQMYDIVKESSYYGLHQEGSFRDKNRLFLVRQVHSGMTANSIIPGTRAMTFLEVAEKNFGRNIVVDLNQPVIEVMPISSDLGSLKEGKQVQREYSTESRYYLRQFLEHFDTDASCVLQSFLLPTIIYRLYITLTASEFDEKFKEDTRLKRDRIIESNEPDDPVEFYFENIVGELAMDEESDDQQKFVDANGREEDMEQEEMELEDEDEGDDSIVDEEDDLMDDDFYSRAGSSIASDDTDYDNDDIVVGPSYRDMITKRALDLNEYGDTDHMKPWDMSEYTVSDVKRQPYEHTFSSSQSEPAANQKEFEKLREAVNRIQYQLMAQINLFSKILTSDSTFLDEDLEFEKRKAKVDKRIAPPIQLDRNAEPIRMGSRERGLIEAFTQRRAGEPYNLEGLENIGDSYLKYMVSVVLFKGLEGNEGFLSSARSRLVGNKYFCHLAKKMRLGSLAITSSFSKDRLMFMLGRRRYETPEELKKFYNRMRAKSLADTFEAIIGGYLVYQGEFEAVLAMQWLGLNMFGDGIFDELHERAVVFARVPTALIDKNNESMRKYYNSCAQKVRKFEEIIGYRFNDPSFLVQAFTHASTVEKCTRSYERLEFLGDAILDFLVTITLIKTTRMDDPGQITNSRSALVNNIAFAQLSMKYKFDLFIQHCNQELYDELSNVRHTMEEDPDMAFLDIIDFDRCVKLLADVFESVAGAIYLDSGNSLDTVWSVYYPMMKHNIDYEIKNPTKNHTAKLFETFPGEKRITFETYDVKTEEGTQVVGVRCRVLCYDETNDYREFEGEGISKSQAKQRAVILALENIPTDEVKKRLDKAFLAKYGTNRPPRSSRGPARGGRGGRGRGGRSYNRGYRPSYSNHRRR